MDLAYRGLAKAESRKIAEIDRAELIEGFYVMEEGQLVLDANRFEVKGWHPRHLQEVMEAFEGACDEGGSVWGAFSGDKLVGMSALSSGFIPTGDRRMQMKLLYVSRGVRGQGVARKLVELCKQKARQLGAKSLYVSATETKGTVDAYMRLGCVLTNHIDPELFEKEPKDIHMEMPL